MSIWQKLFGTKTAAEAQPSPAGSVTTPPSSIRASETGADVHYNLGNTLYSKGDQQGAIREFREAIRLKPNLLEARNNLAAILLLKGDLDQAITEYRELVRLGPDFADGHVNLGTALYNKGDLAGAVAEYRQAARLRPNSADIHYNLANALEDQGEHESAIPEFREAIRLRPDLAEAHFNLGNALARSGNLDGAITEYREVLHLKPDDAKAKEYLQVVISQQAEKRTKTPEITATSVAGGAPAIKTRLEAGHRLFSEHRYNAAMDEAIAVLDLDPKTDEALHLAGTVLYLCSSVHSPEKIRPSVSEDPLLDGLFSQCYRCHRCWPGDPSRKGTKGQLVVMNPPGARCPQCQKVWCRECGHGETFLRCPECRVELEPLREPSGRKRGLSPAKHPDLSLRRICIFKAPPKPRNANSYIKLVLDGLCPEAFHSDADIYFHTGEQEGNQ